MAAVALSTKALGSIVKIKENGVAQDFYVAKHGYSSGRTLLVRRYAYGERQWHSSNVNAYATSTIDSWLNGTYLPLLAADIRALVPAITITYTPGNGNNTVSYISRKVFLLSMTELGLSPPNANVEGTALGIASTLRIATNSTGQAVPQWTRSPNTYGLGYAWYATQDGNAYDSLCNGGGTVRPAFTLPATLYVDDDGNITTNTPPVINYTGSTALGTQNEGFTLSYNVTDADGNAVTVTEKLDNVTKRSFNAALGATQQFQAVLPANFQTILNGAHTLRIEATDGTVTATAKSITFTKAVYNCSITLSAPLAADAMPTAIRLGISGSIPADAVWTAEVCNNAFDASPTWENIKPYIQGGYNYPFTNKAKTAANWGVSFRLSFARGGSNTGGYITGIEGGFQ